VLDDTEAQPSADAESPELAPGTEIAGYVVDAIIGKGGMGKVYGAHHPRIGKRVAIKVLERAYCNDASAVARFEQEARLVNEIRHPNIVDVFQFGELPDRRSFFVMELLTGETLSARIRRGPLPIAEATEILDTICDALEAAHDHSVVHRDLKSDNVFLAASRDKRTVKLLDFGIAKLAGRNDLSSVGKTASGMIVGTPAYMSPEQARGQAVGPKTDVYQLGILTYKMLTGRLPFDAENPFELIVAQLKEPPPSPKKLAPNTPDALARLVVRMMAKASDERPSVAEVRSLCAEQVGARPGAQPGTQPKDRPPRRATSVLVGLTLFLAGVVSLAALLWLRGRNHDDPTPPVAPADLVAPSRAGATEVVPATPAPAVVPAPPSEPTPTAPATAPAAEIEMAPAPARKRSNPTPTDDDVVEDQPATGPGAILFTLTVDSTIEIDGDVVASPSTGGRYEVSPGPHRIRVTAPGRQAVVQTVDVPAGGVSIISIEDGAP